MNVFEALREDHEIQRKLLSQLDNTSGAEPERREAFRQLKNELSQHAGAEEKCFYAPLMKHDIMQGKARHSVAEHHELDEQIAALETLDYDNPHWLRTFRNLKEKVSHHLEEEEHEVFQLAGKALSELQKKTLAKEYRDDMERRRRENG